MTTATSIADLRRGAATESTLDGLLARPMRGAAFDLDAWHAMQERDSALIADSVLNGYVGKEYVYTFKIGGTQVTGISVVGARALAAEYKGIKARLVSAIDKTGPLFIMRTFDPPSMQIQHIPELAEQIDFYEVVLEITDIKTGNSIQTRKRESKFERTSKGGTFERNHYDVIAESKAFRNGVLAIIPQDVVSKFEEKALKAGESGNLVTRSERIAGVLKFAAAKGIALDRQHAEKLTTAQISGLGDAARESLEAFIRAATSAGLIAGAPATVETPPAPTEPKQPAAETPIDPYDDWRLAFTDCQTVEACADLMATCRYKPNSDDFVKIREICEQRQKAIVEAQA